MLLLNHSGVRFASDQPTPDGPLATYKVRVEAKQLFNDDHQLEAVTELEKTFKTIQGYSPSQPSLFSKWLGGSRSKTEAPKGLYIHGAVGGGKTMLMDLFHDCVPTQSKKRVHFNAFMLDIHRRIHSLKDSFAVENKSRSNRYDPIPPVVTKLFIKFKPIALIN